MMEAIEKTDAAGTPRVVCLAATIHQCSESSVCSIIAATSSGWWCFRFPAAMHSK
uniref:Uncharacterized protein n=1 Tax=Aegilops tauschii subsp. strangulata TaxID=200361 RepID=A0A453NET1_AEGTS